MDDFLGIGAETPHNNEKLRVNGAGYFDSDLRTDSNFFAIGYGYIQGEAVVRGPLSIGYGSRQLVDQDNYLHSISKFKAPFSS